MSCRDKASGTSAPAESARKRESTARPGDALVLYTDKSPPDPVWGTCERPRKGLFFQLPDGRLLTVRCGSPNKCGYCAFMSAAEDGMMVLQDALEGEAPRVALTLTTARARTSPAVFRRDVEHVFRAIRRRADDAEYLGRIEFTTGKGTRSGGHRRIHQHTLLKRIDPTTADEIKDDIVFVWRNRTDAHRVELAELRSAAAAAHYLTHHHSKRDQAPSKGWTGRRLRASKGYFGLPGEDRRAYARETLRDRRVERGLRELLALHDVEPGDVEPGWDEVLAGAIERAAEQGVKTRLVRVTKLPTDFDADGLPCAWEDVVMDA